MSVKPVSRRTGQTIVAVYEPAQVAGLGSGISEPVAAVVEKAVEVVVLQIGELRAAAI